MSEACKKCGRSWADGKDEIIWIICDPCKKRIKKALKYKKKKTSIKGLRNNK